MPPRILIIEDEPEIAGFLLRGLREEGYVAEHAADGEAGWQALQAGTWDVVLLDWWLPKIDGLTLLRRYRQAGHQTAVLFLTARDAVSDRVSGLNDGADDYVCKPFSFEELLARVRALVRRRQVESAAVLDFQDVHIDLPAFRARRGGQTLELTSKELALLIYFLRHPQQILTRAQIYENVWRHPYDDSSNTIEVHIKELRRALEACGPRLIHTLRGRGYVFGEMQSEA